MGIEKPSWDALEIQLRGRELSEERVLLERIEVDEIRGQVEEMQRAPEANKTQETIAFAEFAKLDLRVGVIGSAEDVPGAERLLQLTVDLGSETKACVAGIKGSYAAEELVGRAVVVVTNLEPRTIRGLQSECMLLAAKGEGLSLIIPDRPAEPGTSVA